MQHTKHNTTLILYPPGGYGTFIHWILDSITSKSSTSDTPYLDDGSSHKFKGTFLKFSDILNYVETNKSDLFVRSHGDYDAPKPFQKTIDIFKKNFKKIVLIMPTENTLQMLTHNVMTKTNTSHEDYDYENQPTTITKIWRVLKADIHSNIELWQKREQISYILEGQKYYLDIWSIKEHDAVLKISLDYFMEDPKNAIYKILSYVDFKGDIDVFPDLQEWRRLQKYADIDSVIDTITNKIIKKDIEYEWKDKKLSIIDEAKIQMNLRSKGINLKCYQMNVFPSSVLEMQQWVDYR